MRRFIRLGAACLVASSLTRPVIAGNPLGAYRVALGCPAREVFELELIRRVRAPDESSGTLAIAVEYLDGAFLGYVTWSKAGDTSTERAVRHDSCDQVLHALALIGALLLEQEQAPTAASSDSASRGNVVQPEPSQRVATSKAQRETATVRQVSTERKIGSWTFGPSISLTGDSQFAPGLRVAPRLGASLTNHSLLADSQIELNVSVARLTSGTLGGDGRSASIAWTSLRLDACYGRWARERSTLGACTWFDAGRLEGTGLVSGQQRQAGIFWTRIGAGLHGRQALVDLLVLDVKVGAMLATRLPEFYFAAAAGLPEQPIHRVSLVGLMADIGLGLHFW